MTQPRRIVSLISSATEMLFELGLGDQVVAVSHECDYPAEVSTKPRVTRAEIDDTAPSAAIDAEVRSRIEQGAALYKIDHKALSRLAPGLIVTQAKAEDTDLKLACREV